MDHRIEKLQSRVLVWQHKQLKMEIEYQIGQHQNHQVLIVHLDLLHLAVYLVDLMELLMLSNGKNGIQLYAIF